MKEISGINNLYDEYTKSKDGAILNKLRLELEKYFHYLSNNKNLSSNIVFSEEVIETSIFILLERILENKLVIKKDFVGYAIKVFETTISQVWKKRDMIISFEDPEFIDEATTSEVKDFLEQTKQYLIWIQSFLKEELKHDTFEDKVIKYILFSKKILHKFEMNLPMNTRVRIRGLRDKILSESHKFI